MPKLAVGQWTWQCRRLGCSDDVIGCQLLTQAQVLLPLACWSISNYSREWFFLGEAFAELWEISHVSFATAKAAAGSVMFSIHSEQR